MNQSGTCIYSDIALHSKLPFVFLFGLMHFGITLFLCIFDGARSIYYRCINYRSAVHNVTRGIHYSFYCIEKHFTDVVLLISSIMSRNSSRFVMRFLFPYSISLNVICFDFIFLPPNAMILLCFYYTTF